MCELAVDLERPVAVEAAPPGRRAGCRPRRCGRAGTRRCRRRASRRRRRAGRRRGAPRTPLPASAGWAMPSKKPKWSLPPGSASARVSLIDRRRAVRLAELAQHLAALVERARCRLRVDRDEDVRLAGAQAGLPVLGRARAAVAEALGARGHALAELVREGGEDLVGHAERLQARSSVKATCIAVAGAPSCHGSAVATSAASRSSARAPGRRRRCAGRGRRPSGRCSRAGRCPGCRRGRGRRARPAARQVRGRDLEVETGWRRRISAAPRERGQEALAAAPRRRGPARRRRSRRRARAAARLSRTSRHGRARGRPRRTGCVSTWCVADPAPERGAVRACPGSRRSGPTTRRPRAPMRSQIASR